MSLAKILAKIPSSSGPNMELKNNGGDQSDLDIMQNNKKTPNNKSVNGRRRFGENGFEEGGGYMAVKKAKLDNQFNTSTRGLYNNNDTEGASEIFKGLSIYINGYTNPPEPELREKFIRHGGTFHPYNNSKTTYVVATNLAAPTKQRYGSKTITPNWIMDSISAGRALDTRNYMLYNFNQEKQQMTLTQIMSSKKADSEGNHVTSNVQESRIEKNGINPLAQENSCTSDDDGKIGVSDSEEEFFECSQEEMFPSPVHDSSDSNPPKSNGISGCKDQAQHSVNNTETGSCTNSESPNATVKEGSTIPIANGQLPHNADNNQVSPAGNKSERHIKTATDEGFLEDFFGRSRLHLISEQKKDMQIFIGNLRKNMESHKFANLHKFESECGNGDSTNGLSLSDDEAVIMHVDLDCFFVSVGLLKRPHLRGKPVVVTHSSGKVQESKSDIACASYEARKFGVRNGMWVGEAKAMCPSLEVIPYDFEEYRRVSKLFFETVASVTLDIEACSVDEMLIDATPILKKVPGSTPEDLATFLRRIIWAETNCPASIGIGSNRLLARLAVKLAKPDGIHNLKDVDAPEYIQKMKVRDLPGVGWSNEGKLRDLNVDTCGDLLKVPLRDLKTIFGEKTAEKMHNLCRGLDTSEIKVGLERPKSLSVDVNFGIRFSKEDEVTQFLMKICKELSSRAERIQAVSSHFILKLLIRKKGAGEPLKQGGHGLVDSMTRSRTLMNPTRNWHEFFKTASSLVRLMRIPPSEYRGVGVTISDLTFDCDKSNKKSVQRTLTDMPISRAQKMLSIITQKKSKATCTESVVSSKSVPETLSVSFEETSVESVQPPGALDNNTVNVPEENAAATNHITPASARNNSAATNNNKQGKLEFKSKSIATNTETTELPVDINVLRQLPRDIAEEQCKIYGISKDLLDKAEDHSNLTENGLPKERNAETNGSTVIADNFYDNVETVDPSFLSALPDSVRQDVLLQLQEAKSRRKVNDVSPDFDDQEPCSSRQALERSKKMEQNRNKNVQNLEGNKREDHNELVPLEHQTTPIISYSNQNGAFKVDPKRFWDISYDYVSLPSESSNQPSLNGFVEVSDIRELIRSGLQMMTEPTPDEVANLEKYFVQLISDGWIEQTQVLLKFLYRQTIQLGDKSNWTTELNKIINRTQECCIKLYHGELELE